MADRDCDPIDMGPTAQARHGGIVSTRAINDRGQSTWRNERKWRQKANVPFQPASGTEIGLVEHAVGGVCLCQRKKSHSDFNGIRVRSFILTGAPEKPRA
jgi:hypothetical protein